MRALDTNVLVRALTRDDPLQTARAEALLADDEVYVPVTVVLELDWVLRSRYSFAPKQAAKAIEMLASLGNVILGDRDAVVAAALRVGRDGWDFADALHHALALGCEDFATFDGDLSRRAARGQPAAPPITRL